jgi:uncharacterized membrane protein
MTHSPSIAQRTAISILIFVGFCISTYLGLFQLHVLHSVWDPIFTVGSIQVLESSLSKALPLPDSLLGAFGYFCEFITFLLGSTQRFGRGSWILFLYSLIALGMGAVSVGLVFYQTLIVQNWCTLCLVSALISMRLFFPGLRELTLSIREIKKKRQPASKARADVKIAA